MRQTKKMKKLLEQMARIDSMERGKLCRMGQRPHYNHQTWQDGRNVVRYVPAKDVQSLQKAIAGYRLFMDLAQLYADEVIKQTRKARHKASAPTQTPKKRSSP